MSNPGGQQAVIGPSIVIRGELSGSEDLLIEGRVEGEIRLTDNRVTVGSQGRVEADIRGKAVEIRGQVTGNVYSSEQVVVRSSGTLLGNIVAPRVALEDGATFKGAIDMASAAGSPATGTKAGSSAGSGAPGGRGGERESSDRRPATGSGAPGATSNGPASPSNGPAASAGSPSSGTASSASGSGAPPNRGSNGRGGESRERGHAR